MVEKSVFSYKGTVLPIVLRALTFATTSQLGCKCWADLFCCKSACLLIWAGKKIFRKLKIFFHSSTPIWLASFMLKIFFSLHDDNRKISRVKCFVFSYTCEKNKMEYVISWDFDLIIWSYLLMKIKYRKSISLSSKQKVPRK